MGGLSWGGGAALPLLRQKAGDRAVLRAVHIYDENRRVAGQGEALRRKPAPSPP